jgi:hypothetical protein
MLGKLRPRGLTYRKFKQPFFWSELYRQPGELSIVFLVDENPNVASAGLGGVVVGGARSVPDRAVLPALR